MNEIQNRTALRISVIVPALNEAENIDAAIAAILAQARPDLDVEVLVADGGSTDGTVERVRSWQAKAPVRLVACAGDGGLAGDVLTAAKHAAAPIVVVMDADLSHPPASIPDLVAPIAAGTSDMVVGSRYTAGGSTPGWPIARRILSRLGSLLAWPLADIDDPMSGFFAVRREALLAADSAASGFKIGLETIAAGGSELRVSEVPITFTDRTHGASKIGPVQFVAFIRRLMVLAGGAVSGETAVRFAVVGALGVVVDVFVFMLLYAAGAGLATSHVTSFAVATFGNFALNSLWTFADSRRPRQNLDWLRYARFLTVCLLALFLRGGVLAAAVDKWGWEPHLALLLAIASAAMVNYFGSAFFVFPPASSRVSSALRWRVAALGIVAYVVALRLVFSGAVDLLPEEAYYWNYSQHLDIGYLDHPPMVAWLIWLGTKLAGNTEFGVRLGALLCWLIAAFFCFQLTRNLHGKTAALVAILLFCILPFFFLSGLLMMPDAPLTAAWAGALYFLERALNDERRPAAWLGAGLCIGLGMLSKYTIALLAPATLVLILLDPRLRRWLWRPEPYLAALIAAVIFSPVILWNALNDWVSFSFQGPRRLQAPFDFSLDALAGSVLLLLTPIGLASVAIQLFPPRSGERLRWLDDPRLAFAVVYTLVPLSIFITFALFHEVKLNWTGPLWLAALPAVAHSLTAAKTATPGRRPTLARGWRVTIVTALLFYGAALHYMALDTSDLGEANLWRLKTLPVAWEEVGDKIETIETNFEHATGKEPLLVGMDQYYLSSQMAFYDRDGDGVRETAGRSLFGWNSLMFKYWMTPSDAEGRDIILFSLRKEGPIANSSLSRRFSELGPIQEESIYKRGAKVGRIFYRIGYGYEAK